MRQKTFIFLESDISILKNWCCLLVNTATLCVPFLSWPLYPFWGRAGDIPSSVWARQGTPLKKSPAYCRVYPAMWEFSCQCLAQGWCSEGALEISSMFYLHREPSAFQPPTDWVTTAPTLCYYSELIIEVVHGKPATAHNGSNYQGGNCVNAPEQFHLATVYFFLQVIFCVWCQPSPPDCYYPSPLTTSINLLPPSIPLHPEQTQATKHAGRQKLQQQTGKTTRSKEDDPICQPSRVYSTKISVL